MSDLIKQIERFNVDSKFDLTALELTAEYPQSKAFEDVVNSLNPTTESFSIKIGDNILKSFTLYPIDTNLSLSVNESSTSVKSGVVFQDLSFKLKRSWFRKMYLYTALKNDDGSTHTPTDEVGDTIPNEVSKTKMASDVLSDAISANSLGLTVVWDAPNYSVVNKYNRSVMYDTDVSGLISELISPIQFSERYPVVVYLDGNALHIKKKTRTGVPTALNLASAPLLGCKLSKSLSLKPDVDKVIVEYYQDKTPDTSPITEIDIEVTKDRNNHVMATSTNRRKTICGVLVEERQEVSRALVGAITGLVIGSTLYPVSEKVITYNYDVLPQTLDSDGMFQPYRKLLNTLTVEEHYVFPQTNKELFQIVNTHMSYGYEDNKLVQEIETSDYYNSSDWNTPFKTTKTVTSHIKTDKDKVEMRISSYLNDELSTTVSTFREGQLRETPRTNENEADNNNYEIKYVCVTAGSGSVDIGDLSSGGGIPSGGSGSINGKVINLSSRVLSKAQLIEGAHELIADGSYIKYTLELNMAPLMWLNKGEEFNITLPNANYQAIWSGHTIENVTLNLSTLLSDLSFILEDQNYAMENNSLLGTVTFTAYKYL